MKQTQTPRAAATQDPDLIAVVVRLADDPGYRVAERSGRVFRVEAGQKGSVEPVPTHKADVVRQLIDARALELGGNHSIRNGNEIAPSRSVLVTKDLRGRVTRWANLRPLKPGHRAATGAAPDPSAGEEAANTSGRITVHPSENGRSAVTCGRWSGAVVRARSGAPGRYAVHNHAGKLIGHASSRAAGARLLARHCGWAPGPVDTTTRTGGRP